MVYNMVFIGEKIPWGNGKLIDNANTATNASTTSSAASSSTASPASAPPAATSEEDTGVTPNAAAADASHHSGSSVIKYDPSLWIPILSCISSAVFLHSVYQ